MATVTVIIDGKTYRMACDEGQEAHLAQLAHGLNLYIHHLKSSFGEIGDHRLSVMAGIMLMDEMHDLEKRFSALEEQYLSLLTKHETLTHQLTETEEDLSAKLNQLAERILLLASRIMQKN